MNQGEKHIRLLERAYNRIGGCLCGGIRKRLLRRQALRNRDEVLRLSAARQLQDDAILRQMALEGDCASIRRQAAALVRQQSFLAAIALCTWDLHTGLEVVERIEVGLLLQRVARSARQDAIRLAAAKKLMNRKLLKKIALATADISLRWEAACCLKDPELMADVALFKPGHKPMDPIREKAHAALLNHLNQLQRARDVNGLRSFMLLQEHLPFKLLAFLRLPDEAVQFSVLQHLARQKFSYIASETIRCLLIKIKSAGWSVKERVQLLSCTHCKGKGVLLLKSVTVVLSRYTCEMVPCPECGGAGEIPSRVVACKRPYGAGIEFKMPLEKGPQFFSPLRGPQNRQLGIVDTPFSPCAGDGAR